MCVWVATADLLAGIKDAAFEFCLKVNTESKYVSKGTVAHRGTLGAGGSSRMARRIKSLCAVGRTRTGNGKGQRQARPQGAQVMLHVTALRHYSEESRSQSRHG